jgi:acyl carrier protein
MTDHDLINQVQDIFLSIVLETEKFPLERQLREFEGWDSLAHMQLVVELEQNFSIRFHMGEVETSRTILDLVRLVQKHLDEK